MQCTAKSKRSRKQCKRGSTPGKDKCYIHGGKTPIKHGLYSKYPKVIAAKADSYMTAAEAEGGVEILRQTISVVATILAIWVESGNAFKPSEASATSAMLLRLTNLVDAYERLANPKPQKLEVTHAKNDKSTEALVNETEALIAEAESICRGVARGKKG